MATRRAVQPFILRMTSATLNQMVDLWSNLRLASRGWLMTRRSPKKLTNFHDRALSRNDRCEHHRAGTVERESQGGERLRAIRNHQRI
jgi:hypothetical protein